MNCCIDLYKNRILFFFLELFCKKNFPGVGGCPEIQCHRAFQGDEEIMNEGRRSNRRQKKKKRWSQIAAT